MKVCSSPVPFSAPDWRNYDTNVEMKREDDHKQAVIAWLKQNGYNGPHTGKIYSTPVADGRAIYMLADGKKSFLIHLPYGDAYQNRDVEFLPKAEILRRIAASEKISALFSTKAP